MAEENVPVERRPEEQIRKNEQGAPPKQALKRPITRNAIPNNVKRTYITYIEENKTTAYQGWKKFKAQYPNVSESQVRQWLKKKEGIFQKPAGKRAFGGGRKPTSQAMERLLFDYISQRVRKKEPVKRMGIQKKALEIASVIEVKGFRASSGWLRNFLRRYNISLK